jgi:hypothetical protein
LKHEQSVLSGMPRLKLSSFDVDLNCVHIGMKNV